MMGFNILLSLLCLIVLILGLTVARRDEMKRGFSLNFFLVLVTFFPAMGGKNWITIGFMLITLTVFHVYILTKKKTNNR